MTINPDTLTWRGHRLTTLAREELIAVVLFQQKAIEESDRNFRSMACLNRQAGAVRYVQEPSGLTAYHVVAGCLASAIAAAWIVIALRPAGYF